MSSKGKFYMTTAIAYTSGKPHIGNTYEIVLADAIARFRRQEGYDVYFQTGTDEHGQKIQEKAEKAGMTPQAFVDEMAAEVRRNLVNVPWFGQTVQFTNVNGAADQLKKVAAELAKYPELKKYLKSSGTFYWRTVRGAKRQSAHSYGIAFDIGVDHSDYWLWKNKGAGETAKIKYANRIPRQIVEIFRKHGFIWGGAWYHYDTMHFEYRPEILKYAGMY